MSEDSIEEMNKSEGNSSNNGLFNTALFIDIPVESRIKEAADGLECIKLSSRENLQTPIATPKQSFNDFLSSDLMKRLDANSPFKYHNDLKRRLSDLSLVNCESESDLNVLSQQVHKTKQEVENKWESKEKDNKIEENYIPPKKNLSTRNFKLKTDMISSKQQEDDTFLENGPENTLQSKEEPKSLFNNSFRNFQQTNNFFSPVYKTQQTKQVRGDSSPIYTYYDGTAECLSQTFFDEFKKSNNDQFMSKNNFLKKNETNLIDNESSLNTNFFEEMSQKNIYLENSKSLFDKHKIQTSNDSNKLMSSKKSQKSTSSRTSSKKKNNNVNCNKSQENVSVELDEYTVEMFGRKGWICEMCNNFNYDSNFF